MLNSQIDEAFASPNSLPGSSNSPKLPKSQVRRFLSGLFLHRNSRKFQAVSGIGISAEVLEGRQMLSGSTVADTIASLQGYESFSKAWTESVNPAYAVWIADGNRFRFTVDKADNVYYTPDSGGSFELVGNLPGASADAGLVIATVNQSSGDAPVAGLAAAVESAEGGGGVKTAALGVIEDLQALDLTEGWQFRREGDGRMGMIANDKYVFMVNPNDVIERADYSGGFRFVEVGTLPGIYDNYDLLPEMLGGGELSAEGRERLGLAAALAELAVTDPVSAIVSSAETEVTTDEVTAVTTDEVTAVTTDEVTADNWLSLNGKTMIAVDAGVEAAVMSGEDALQKLRNTPYSIEVKGNGTWSGRYEMFLVHNVSGTYIFGVDKNDVVYEFPSGDPEVKVAVGHVPGASLDRRELVQAIHDFDPALPRVELSLEDGQLAVNPSYMATEGGEANVMLMKADGSYELMRNRFEGGEVQEASMEVLTSKGHRLLVGVESGFPRFRVFVEGVGGLASRWVEWEEGQESGTVELMLPPDLASGWYEVGLSYDGVNVVQSSRIEYDKEKRVINYESSDWADETSSFYKQWDVSFSNHGIKTSFSHEIVEKSGLAPGFNEFAEYLLKEKGYLTGHPDRDHVYKERYQQSYQAVQDGLWLAMEAISRYRNQDSNTPYNESPFRTFDGDIKEALAMVKGAQWDGYMGSAMEYTEFLDFTYRFYESMAPRMEARAQDDWDLGTGRSMVLLQRYVAALRAETNLGSAGQEFIGDWRAEVEAEGKEVGEVLSELSAAERGNLFRFMTDTQRLVALEELNSYVVDQRLGVVEVASGITDQSERVAEVMGWSGEIEGVAGVDGEGLSFGDGILEGLRERYGEVFEGWSDSEEGIMISSQSFSFEAYHANVEDNQELENRSASFYISRQLSNERLAVLGGSHNFIVTNARYLGDPNATVYSFGKTDSGKLGRINTKTTNDWSKGTYAADINAWLSLGIETNDNPVRYSLIPTTSTQVAKYAESLVEEHDYNPTGINSNAAADAIADMAINGDMLPPDGKRHSIGSSHSDKIRFTAEH